MPLLFPKEVIVIEINVLSQKHKTGVYYFKPSIINFHRKVERVHHETKKGKQQLFSTALTFCTMKPQINCKSNAL